MQYVVVLPDHLVQLVIHVATNNSTVLFDLGDVPYRIIRVAISGVVTISHGSDQMGTCTGSAAACQVGIGFGQQGYAGGFDAAHQRTGTRIVKIIILTCSLHYQRPLKRAPNLYYSITHVHT